MSATAPDPSKRALSPKEMWPGLLLVAYLLASFAVAKLYSTTLGLLLVAPLLVYAAVAVWHMPRAEKARIAAAMEAQEKTPWGRVGRLYKLAMLLFLVALVVQWLLGQL
jgi:hypothetical protein